ncbi:MAG: GIY-YIG nuclease family protein [bacterium]|nr:GIY-YIG nuclease family protein [bacterium]
MFTVYILYSSVHHQKYIGYTSDLIQRFYSHNKLATKGYTIKYRPWVVILTEVFESKEMALAREKSLKSGKGREWINDSIIPQYRAIGFISA